MISRDLMDNTFALKQTDTYPIVAPYLMLSNADHWAEYTGRPIYEFYEWQWQEPEEHVKLYERFYESTPFDWMQPYPVSDTKARREMEIVFVDNQPFMRNKQTGDLKPVPKSIHDVGSNGAPNETRNILSIADIKGALPITNAGQIRESGDLDMQIAFCKRYGHEHFIVTGGVVNTFYSCTYHIGMTNLYQLLIDEPDFILELEKHLLEQNIETIRSLAMAGGDAIYIDDATATNDMISLDFYERFSLPFLREQVKEIKRLGKKAILIYFGGVADRLHQIASLNSDGLIIEASMKRYVNDVGMAASICGPNTVIFGNLNPLDVEKQSEAWIEAELRRQAAAVRSHAPFVVSTGSPLTPGTSIDRMRAFINAARRLR